ncbi:12679_t:CDS:2, partial [Ambispora leptoticha]
MSRNNNSNNDDSEASDTSTIGRTRVLGSLSALVLWTVGGITALFGSLVYTELGSSIPDGGGETVYLQKAYPRPKALFSYMFSLIIIVIIRNESPLCDIDYLHPNKFIVDWNFWQLRLWSLSAVILVTFYHILSNKWANHINQTLTIIKMSTLIVIFIIGIAEIPQSINNELNTNWKNMFPNNAIVNVNSLTAAFIPILFAYDDSLDEFYNPQEQLKKSNSISVLVVTVLYLGVNIAYTNIPLSNITGSYAPSEILAGGFAFQIGGFRLARTLSFFICLSAFGALAANICAGSR